MHHKSFIDFLLLIGFKRKLNISELRCRFSSQRNLIDLMQTFALILLYCNYDFIAQLQIHANLLMNAFCTTIYDLQFHFVVCNQKVPSSCFDRNLSGKPQEPQVR